MNAKAAPTAMMMRYLYEQCRRRKIVKEPSETAK
jgi:hypothetical protein